MSSVALLLLQAATAVAPPAAAPDDRLLHPVTPRQCAGSADQIVVCAKDPDTYRLREAEPRFDTDSTLLKAEWRLFGDAKAGIGTSQRNVGGYPSNAVMATIKIPF